VPASLLSDEVFWRRLRAAPRRILGLDYDGTLAPFQVDRLAAVPSPGVVELLGAISAGPVRLAIISGRRLDEVLLLLGAEAAGLHMDVIGSHGYEVRRAGEAPTLVPLSAAQTAGLSRAAGALEGHAHQLERKAASLAFHTRGLDLGEAARLEAEAATIFDAEVAAAIGALAARPFDGGVELRAVGVDKGTALTELLADEPDDALCVYVGDDRTDEDAFEVVQRRGGLGVKVGSAAGYTSCARAQLPGCPEVVTFLERWRDALPS
jgi:trehalose-phosphatase